MVITEIKKALETLVSIQSFIHNEIEKPLVSFLEELEKLREKNSDLLYFVDSWVVIENYIERAADIANYDDPEGLAEKIIHIMRNWRASDYPPPLLEKINKEEEIK